MKSADVRYVVKLDDVPEPGSLAFEDGADVGEGLLGLSRDVAGVDELAIDVEPDLAGDEEELVRLQPRDVGVPA